MTAPLAKHTEILNYFSSLLRIFIAAEITAGTDRLAA